jgi:integrase
MRAVTREWVLAFRAHLLENLNPNTAFVYFVRLKAAIKEAQADGHIRVDPLKRIPAIRQRETMMSFLTIDELRTLAAEPIENDHVRRAFLFSCYTGLRFSDIVALRWAHIKDRRLELRQQKTQETAYLPLNDQALELLGDRGEAGAAVFVLPAHATVWRTIKRWAKRAGITKKMGYHTSRHTFATLALTYDADLYTVSKLLGHKNIAVTQRYAKVIDRKKDEAVAKLPRL